MFFKKICKIAVLLMCFCGNTSALESLPNIAFLQFVDNTQYSQLNTRNVFSELLLNELVELNDINIVEHGVINEALEEEKYLNNDNTLMNNAAENGDFAFLLENQRHFNIYSTKPGDFIPLDSVKRIGNKYCADYLLHGTIDKLGTEEEIHTEFMPIFGLQKVKLYLTATTTVRLVEVKTGKVVWICKSIGVAKDRKYDAGIFSAGADGFSATMYDEALADSARNLAKELNNAIEKKQLILRKGNL